MDNLISMQDMIAALQFQVDWGVLDVIEDEPCDSFASAIKKLEKTTEIQQKSSVSRLDDRNNHDGFFSTVKDFDELLVKCHELPDFILPRFASHVVRPQLVKKARLLVIGELPTDEEDKTGQVFAGGEGILLEQIFSSLGWKKEDISLSPALPWRMPGGQGQPLPAPVFKHSVAILHRIIEMAEPQYILTLGQNPLNLVCGRKLPLVKHRGKIEEITIRKETNPVLLLPTYSLAQLHNTVKIRRYFWYDMLLLAENMGL